MLRLPFCAVLAFCGGGFLPAEGAPKPLGLILPDREEVLSRGAAAHSQPKQTPPSSAMVDLRWLPPVGTQLNGNCGAWPGAYYMKTYYEAREHGWEYPSPSRDPDHVMSVAFPYALEYTPSLQGSSPAFIADMLKRYGTTSWAVRPESSGYTAPVESEWRAAAPNRISDWYYVDLTTDDGRSAAKGLLAEGNPLGTGWGNTTGNIDAYAGGEADGVSNDVLYAYSVWGDPERIPLGHAVTIVGYDDAKSYTVEGESRQGAWLVVNQWGTNWGVSAQPGGSRGYMWIAYPMLTYAQAFEDRVGYEPKDFFVYHIRADIPAYVDVTLMHGDPSAPLISIAGFDFHSLDSWDTTIAQDITEWHDSFKAWAWRLSLFNVEATNAGSVRWQPEILSARLELDGYAPIEFGGMPLKGVNLQTVYVDQAPNVRENAPFPGLQGVTSGRACWIDWNGDGRDDWYIASMNSLHLAEQGILNPTMNVVYLANGDGTYELTSLAGVPYGEMPVLMDFDNNGRADIMVADQSNDCKIDLWLQDTEGRLCKIPSIMADRCYASLSGVDFDNDGDSDVLVAGGHYVGQDWIQESRMWLNDGSAHFTESSIALPPFSQYALWADFDQDGWADVLIDDQFYRNVQGQSLEPAGALPQSAWSIAPGDFNGDGRIDLACLVEGQSILLQNDGAFSFTIAETLPGYPRFSTVPNALFLGDFDGDGLVDLTQSGITGSSTTHQRRPREVAFHRRLPGGGFERPGLIFPPLSDGILLGGDIDNDGDMDIFASGQRTVGPTEASHVTQPWDSAWYRNALVEFAGAGQNTPPMAVVGLSANVTDAALGDVDLTWTAGSDAEEVSPLALGYRIRVGTAPGGGQVVSEAASRERGGLWLSPGVPGKRLRGLAPGTYYWAVRAVDSSWVAGPWSTEHTFTVGTSVRRGEINGDAVIDAADARALQKAASQHTRVPLSAGDLNENGRIDDDDASGIPSLITGGKWRTGTIGPEGGVLSMNEIRLRIPSGCLPTPREITIERTRQNPFESTEAPQAFALKGLPSGYGKPIQIEVFPSHAAPPYLFVGEDSFRQSSGVMVTAWRPSLATLLGDGSVRVTLSPPESSAKTLATESPDGGTLQLILTEITVEGNDRWRVTLPTPYLALYGRIIRALDAAYDRYSQAPFGFSYAKRTSWPMDIVFRPLAEDGGFVDSMWGTNYASIELHSKYLAAPDGNGSDPAIEVLIGHEFFHFVQSMYDPRGSYDRAKNPAVHYWINEMTATWAESLFATSADYLPVLVDTYKDAPLSGLPLPNSGSTALHQRRQGYGLSPLAKWLTAQYGTDVLLRLYTKINAGTQPITAISTSLFAGAQDNQIWWSAFAAAWIDDEKLFHYNGHLLLPYPDSEFPTFAGGTRTIQLVEPGKTATHHAIKCTPYGVTGITVANLNPALSLLEPAGTELMIRLKDPSRALGLSISVLDPQEPTISVLPERLSLDVLRADIGNMKTLAEKNSYVAAAFSNTAPTSMAAAEADVYILYNGPQTILEATCGSIRLSGPRFPEYRVGGTLEVKKCGAIEKSDVYGYQSALLGVVWPTKNETFPLALTLNRLTGDTTSFQYSGYRYDYEMAGTPTYRLVRRNRDYTRIYEETSTTSLSFDLPIDASRNYQLYDVYIIVPVRERVYTAEDVLVTDQTNTEEIGCFSALLLIGDRNWEELDETPFDPTAPKSAAIVPRLNVFLPACDKVQEAIERD